MFFISSRVAIPMATPWSCHTPSGCVWPCWTLPKVGWLGRCGQMLLAIAHAEADLHWNLVIGAQVYSKICTLSISLDKVETKSSRPWGYTVYTFMYACTSRKFSQSRLVVSLVVHMAVVTDIFSICSPVKGTWTCTQTVFTSSRLRSHEENLF